MQPETSKFEALLRQYLAVTPGRVTYRHSKTIRTTKYPQGQMISTTMITETIRTGAAAKEYIAKGIRHDI